MPPRATGGPAAPERKTPRRWHLAPVILHGPESLECARVLESVPGPAGVLLWQAVRDALLWTGTPRELRGALFAAGAAQRRREAIRAAGDPETAEPLAALSALLEDAAGADARAVATACERIAEWAAGEGRVEAALDFAQAAALARPGEPRDALRVAQLAGRLDESARAETWLRRTVTLARRGGAWEVYAEALLGVGRLYAERGTVRVARRFMVRALRSATRRGSVRIRAEALRALLELAIAQGRLKSAERYLAAAVAMLGQAAGELPELALAASRLRLAQGLSPQALAILDVLLPLGWEPRSRRPGRFTARAVLLRCAALDPAGAGAAAAEALRIATRAGDPELAAAAQEVLRFRDVAALPDTPRQPANRRRVAELDAELLKALRAASGDG